MINMKSRMKILLAIAAATVVVVAAQPAAAALPAGCNTLELNDIAWDRNQDKMPAACQQPDTIGSTNLMLAVIAIISGTHNGQGGDDQGGKSQGGNRQGGNSHGSSGPSRSSGHGSGGGSGAG